MKKLTKKQLQLLNAIEKLSKNAGVPPTIAELKKEMMLNSDQSIYQLLQKLSEAGLIEREAGKRRSLRLVTSKANAVMDTVNTSQMEAAGTTSHFKMDIQQKMIFNKLCEIDNNIGQIYKGALFTMSQRKHHPDWMPPVASALRGIFGVLTRENKEGDDLSSDVDQKSPSIKKTEKEDGVHKISKAFDLYGGISKVEPAIWKHWHALNNYFVAIAHYGEGYRLKEAEFMKKIEEFENLLSKYILSSQFEIHETIDQIIRKGPNKALINDIQKYLSRNTATYSYFFSNIGFEWFEFLRFHKILKPTHQVGEYLTRVAQALPEQTLDLVKKYNEEYHSTVNNKFFRHYFIASALVMPASKARGIITIMKKQRWMQETLDGHDFIFFSLRKLLERFIDEKHYDHAEYLAKEILDIKPPETKDRSLADIEGYIDGYSYQEIIKSLHTIPGDNLLPFINVLMTVLDKLTETSDKNKNQFFYMWRHSIGRNESHHHNVADSVIDGIRDLAIAYINHKKILGGSAITVINDIFSSRNSEIVTRLKLFFYTKYPIECLEKAEQMLIECFDNYQVEREYDTLLEQEFPNTSEVFRTKYLELVQGGPVELNKQTDPEYVRYWKLRKLFLVKKHLNRAWSEKYSKLLNGEDEARFQPRYSGIVSSWSGPTTPKGHLEMASMPITELTDYLSNWRPVKGFGEPSRLGLARELSQVVKDNPQKYSKCALLFNRDDLHPVYLYQFFYGLKESLKGDQPIEWASVLDLMSAIVEKAKNDKLVIFKNEDDDWDISWSNVFQYIADLLEGGLASSIMEPPYSLRSKIWLIIEYVCEEKEPNVEYEEKYSGENRDYHTLAINTTRGQAFYALFYYIFWCDKHNKPLSESRIPGEAKITLENHLDIGLEPSLTIRSVYGQFFPWLYTYDKKWARSYIDTLFPLSDFARRYAAWEMYLLNAVSKDLFEDLRPQYTQAIQELRKKWPEKRGVSVDPVERLIAHLMIAYSYSVISYSDPLLTSFYSTANREQKAEAVNFVGRVYIASEDATKAHKPSKKRIQELWELRINESECVEELSEFGWWVKPGYFSDDWMLEMLFRTLNKTNGIIEPDFRVLETLKKLASKYPLLVAQCLQKIVKAKHQDQFQHMMRKEDVKNIIEQLYSNSDEQVRVIISQISDQMLRMGNNDFRSYTRPVNLPIIKINDSKSIPASNRPTKKTKRG